MPRKDSAAGKPTLPPDRALQALKKQLLELQKLKGRRFDEADSDETRWEHFTQSIIEGAFGNPSSNLNKFYTARNAGYHNLMGITQEQKQQNFEKRLQEYEVLLESLVSELNLYLPEEPIKGAYEPGEQYEFYHDLSSLIAQAKHEVVIVDAYLDEQVFNLYVSKVPSGVGVRLLSNKIAANVETVAKMYAKTKPLALRSSSSIHDRALFVDHSGWVIGQSIKDAAKTKPTYMIELTEPGLSTMRSAHEALWSSATVII